MHWQKYQADFIMEQELLQNKNNNIKTKMEVIVITDSQKCQQLISGAKILNSTSADIINIIETEVFLNHHHNISLYLIKDNPPFQFQLPLKIAKQLIERSQGSQIQMIINDKETIYLSSQIDLVEIFSKIQLANNLTDSNSLIDSRHNSHKSCKPLQNQIKYSFRYWQIEINLIILDRDIKCVHYRDLIMQIPGAYEDQQLYQSKSKKFHVFKLIVFLNENNYDKFAHWRDNDQEYGDQFYPQQKLRLSNQYLTLKQETDNEKNAFRNKIKMVEAILGQNISIQKLLCEDEGKEENMQYKRLKQTFQTIKNIDNVIVEQEDKIQKKKLELNQKKKEKQVKHYGYAKKIAQQKKQIQGLSKQIQNLWSKIQYVRKQKEEHLAKRSFEVTKDLKPILCKKITDMKNISKKTLIIQSQVFNRQKLSKFGKKIAAHNNKSRQMSQILCLNQNRKQYYHSLKKRAEVPKKQSQSLYFTNKPHDKYKIEASSNQSLHQLLLNLYNYFNYVNKLGQQIDERFLKNSAYKNESIFKSTYANTPQWQQFPILLQILNKNTNDKTFDRKSVKNDKILTDITSCSLVNLRGKDTKRKQKQKTKQISQESQKVEIKRNNKKYPSIIAC